MSPARLEALEKARRASPLIPIVTVQEGAPRAQISSEGAKQWFELDGPNAQRERSDYGFR